jgi:hypothetical protein
VKVTAKLAQVRIRIAPGERPVIEHFESAEQI